MLIALVPVLLLAALQVGRAQYCPTTLYQVYAGEQLGASAPYCPAITFTTQGLLLTTTGRAVTSIDPTLTTYYQNLVQVCNFYYETATPNTRFTFSFASMTRTTSVVLPNTITRSEKWIGGYYAGATVGQSPLFAYFPWIITESLSDQPQTSTTNSFAPICYRPSLTTIYSFLTSVLPVITIVDAISITVPISIDTVTETVTLTLTVQTRVRTATATIVVTTVTSTSTAMTTATDIVSTDTENVTRTRSTTFTLSTTTVSVVNGTTVSATVTDLVTSTINEGVVVSETVTVTDLYCSARTPIPPFLVV